MIFTLKIGGEAGFGIMTTGLAFSKIAARLGYHVFDYVEYPSLIRGGHNAYEGVISDVPYPALQETINMLVCLNKETYDVHKKRLTSSSIVVYDPTEFTPEPGSIGISIPFNQILKETGGKPVMINMIALGAACALLGIEETFVADYIKQEFTRKGEEVIAGNIQFAHRGYDEVERVHSTKKLHILSNRSESDQVVLSGNDAFSLGATLSDCRLFSAYPMTPSSSVLTMLAGFSNATGMIVRHAEDEISVINTALGASFAGVRSAVGTSGGGFALMVETLSLAGIAEIPLVIFLSSRPGPATGMPTWTEQGDLLFAVHAGHGEFGKIVLTPGDVEEMLTLSVKAFDLADHYQTPIIVMSDMFLSESHATLAEEVAKTALLSKQINRHKITFSVSDSPYLRYKNEPDGISPLLVPRAKKLFYQANSYEHLEDGHTTEDARERIIQVEKRLRKMNTYLATDFEAPVVSGDQEQSTIFVTWGSTKRPVRYAVEQLRGRGIRAGNLHFTHVFPMNEDMIRPFFTENNRYVLVENNATGQFGKLLRSETGISLDKKILRFDGRPISAGQIVSYVSH